MAFTQKNIRDAYRRILTAMPTEFADVPATSIGAEAAAGLAAAFAIIEQKGGEQESSGDTGQAGTAVRVVARRNLYDFLLTLAQTAQTISLRKTGFNLNYPSPWSKNDTEMLNDARAVAPKAIADEADFMRYELTKEFVESGADRIEAFETSFEPTDEATAARAEATGSKRQAYKDADLFYDELDRYMRNRYRNQPAKLHAWKVVSRIERSPKNNDSQS